MYILNNVGSSGFDTINFQIPLNSGNEIDRLSNKLNYFFTDSQIKGFKVKPNKMLKHIFLSGPFSKLNEHYLSTNRDLVELGITLSQELRMDVFDTFKVVRMDYSYDIFVEEDVSKYIYLFLTLPGMIREPFKKGTLYYNSRTQRTDTNSSIGICVYDKTFLSRMRNQILYDFDPNYFRFELRYYSGIKRKFNKNIYYKDLITRDLTLQINDRIRNYYEKIKKGTMTLNPLNIEKILQLHNNKERSFFIILKVLQDFLNQQNIEMDQNMVQDFIFSNTDEVIKLQTQNNLIKKCNVSQYKKRILSDISNCLETLCGGNSMELIEEINNKINLLHNNNIDTTDNFRHKKIIPHL